MSELKFIYLLTSFILGVLMNLHSFINYFFKKKVDYYDYSN